MVRKQTLIWMFCILMVVCLTTAFSERALAKGPINTDGKGVAIKGYDPVAYFTMDKHVKGNNKYEHEWKGAKWWFSTDNHKKLFIEDPEKYVPRYGGYCAYGVAVDALFDIQPEAWSIVDGKLYLNKNLDVRETWRKDIPGNTKKANMNWPGVLKK